jgi:polar amino acid transport system substrate-binding protein
MKRTFRLVALAAAFALVAAGCGDGTATTTTQATTTTVPAAELELVTAGTLTVCTDTPYPPMEYVDPVTNEYTGFDMELMEAIAEELGLTMTVNEPGWDAITGGLAFTSGECDVAAASITITPERAQEIDFSTPYFNAEQSLLVRADSGITDLASAVGEEIAVQTGTTGHFYLRDEGPAGIVIVEFPDADGPYLALEANDVAGFMTDLVANQDYADNSGGIFVVVETFATDEEYGLATKDTPNLLAAINAALAKFRADGTYDAIYDKWFPIG